jgi:RNA polymerase sigma-70 factor, ECF subfamily
MVVSLSQAAGDVAVSDQELVGAARGGDRAAFGELYQRYARMVHGVLVAAAAPDMVDDLLQDVFLKAMTQLRQLRNDTHFGGWIAAIARNRAVDYYRRSRETRLPAEVNEVKDPTSGPETSHARAEAAVALAAIRELPLAYRETLALRLVEGMTGPEIAQRTGLTPDSVRVNLHRGMKLLHAKLAGSQGGQKRLGGDMSNE